MAGAGDVRAHSVERPPAAMAVTLVPPGKFTFTGTSLFAVPPSPSSPSAL